MNNHNLFLDIILHLQFRFALLRYTGLVWLAKLALFSEQNGNPNQSALGRKRFIEFTWLSVGCM